ncbi:MAG: hypothetical protein ACLU5C_07520 [Acutalibacter sp.]
MPVQNGRKENFFHSFWEKGAIFLFGAAGGLAKQEKLWHNKDV